jgi:hypothetical protein
VTLRNDSICSDAQAITPSNTTVLDLNGFYVGTTGAVSVITAGGTTVTFPSVPAGAVIPLRVQTIRSTGTTASNIVGFKD